MRCTAEILSDVKDNIDVDKEELRLALLVLDSVNFFNHNRMKRLLAGGIGAKLTEQEFPGPHKDLGISKQEWSALKSDPYKYLTPEFIPGTEEYAKIHNIGLKLLDKLTNNTTVKES